MGKIPNFGVFPTFWLYRLSNDFILKFSWLIFKWETKFSLVILWPKPPPHAANHQRGCCTSFLFVICKMSELCLYLRGHFYKEFVLIDSPERILYFYFCFTDRPPETHATLPTYEGELVPFMIGVFPPDPKIVSPELTTLFRFRIVGLLIVLVVKLDVLMIFLVLSETF